MTIRTKSLALVTGSAVLLLLAGAILSLSVMHRFAAVEDADQHDNLRMVRSCFASALSDLRASTTAWATSEEAYRYVQGQLPRFPGEVLAPGAQRDRNLGTIAFLGGDGRVLCIAGRNSLPRGLLGRLPNCLRRVVAGETVSGFLAFEDGFKAFVAMPVCDAIASQPPRGVCLALRDLDRSAVADITAPLGLTATLEAAPAGSPAEHLDILSGDRARGFVTLAVPDGLGQVRVVLDLPRPIDAEARHALIELLVGGAGAIVMISVLLVLLLERGVLRRVLRLGEELAAQDGEQPAAITVDGRDEISALAGAVATVLDQQRQERDRAEASQQRYRTLFQRNGDAILVIEGDTILDANAAATRMFGAVSRQALLSVPVSRLLDLAGQQRIGAEPQPSTAQFERSGGRDQLREWTMHTLDGRPISTEVRQALVEIDGREAMQVQIRDITARRSVEAERRLLAGLLEATSDWVVVADEMGRIAFLNAAARRALGVAADADLTRLASDHLFTRQAREEQRTQAIPAALAHGAWRGVTELQAADGTVIPASQVLVTVADGSGRVTHFGSLLRDISAERQREHQLLDAGRRAEEAAQAKSSFLAMMSHELRTPLNGVIGMASLLQEAELGRENRELVDTIKVCADNLLSLINDILDLSKIEAGAMELERVRFNIRELVESTVMVVAEQALAKGLEIGCLVAPGIPDLVEGDPTRLRQVLINLLGNAVKFTAHGEVVVNLAPQPAEPGDPQGSMRISFAVTDTGIGIDPAVIPRLFNAFVQADGGTTRRHGGTGLGLAISQRLMGMMGGRITVSSEPGVGSTFSFHLALPVRQASSESLPPDLTRATVVIADPMPTVRRIAGTILGSWGARIVEASSLAQVAQEVRTTSVSFVICAQQLVDGRAEDVVRLCHGREHPIPVAVLATFSQRQREAVLATTGADALIIKPLRSGNLKEVVIRLLQRHTRLLTPVPQPPAPNGSGRTVLVVEDNPTNRILALRVLETLGIGARAVASGAEALSVLEQEHFDLVLMDCQMPELDGFETTRRFREHEAADASRPRTVVVAMTAHALSGDRDRCLQAGMDDYLTKPYTVEDVRQKLDTWLT